MSTMACITKPPQVPHITEIKRAIPAHCFTSSLPRSLWYVLQDLVLVALLYIFITEVDKLELPWILAIPSYLAYWFLQGTVMWAVFVLGHDCGHGSFSRYQTVNDVVGNLLHALILVPYYPWKISHNHHHKNTGNIDKDEVFYPLREHDADCKSGKWLPYFGLGIGWFFYLVKGYGPRKLNHFNPFGSMFVKHSGQCFMSVTSVLIWMVILIRWQRSLLDLSLHILVPELVFGSWLVITTFLHHQDDGVLWYGNDEWDYVRGQLSSVDRDYGWAHGLVHNIGTHQVHHLFSRIPHYHLEEATAAFRKVYPDLVRSSDEGILFAFTRTFKLFMEQSMVPDDVQIHKFGQKRQD